MSLVRVWSQSEERSRLAWVVRSIVLKSRDARDCVNNGHPPAAFLSLPLPPFLPLLLSLSSVPLHSTFPRKFLPFRREGRKTWVGHVSLHFALLHRARRIGREIRSGWGTLYSVAELAGDFIEVDLDRSAVRPEERLRAREKNRLDSFPFFFFLLFSSRVTCITYSFSSRGRYRARGVVREFLHRGEKVP